MKLKFMSLLFILLATAIAYYAFLRPEKTKVRSNMTSEKKDRITDSKVFSSVDVSGLRPAQPVVNLNSAKDLVTRAYDSGTDRNQSADEKKLTAENSKRIFAQMKSEEIKSLQFSIANDKKILKELELSGTGIEDYKYIESNLLKRRTRLKSLLSSGNN